LAGAHRAGAALSAGRLEKRYLALVEGRLRPARWEDRLERDESSLTTGPAAAGSGATHGTDTGRVAVSVVEPVVADRDATLAVIRIETGRTHQIRAQAALHGHPLAGDRKYGGHGRSAYLLHAASLTAPRESDLGFEHLEAPLPAAFAERIERVFGAGTLRIVSRALSGPQE
ncbi:MAG: pseudouridine synthase, partial [Spirochaetota bacterium]